MRQGQSKTWTGYDKKDKQGRDRTRHGQDMIKQDRQRRDRTGHEQDRIKRTNKEGTEQDMNRIG